MDTKRFDNCGESAPFDAFASVRAGLSSDQGEHRAALGRDEGRSARASRSRAHVNAAAAAGDDGCGGGGDGFDDGHSGGSHMVIGDYGGNDDRGDSRWQERLLAN